MRYLILTAAVGVLAAIGACGDAIKGNTIAKMEVTEGQRAVVANGTVTTRADLPARVQIGNSGNGVLQVKSIIIESSPAGAFSIVSLPIPTDAAPVEVWPEALSHSFTIAYNPTAVTDGSRATGTVRIRTNMTLAGDEFTFYVAPEVAIARLVVSPTILDFANVSANQSATLSSNLLNTGSAPLSIDRVIFAGHPGYVATIGGVEYHVSDVSAASGIVLNPPLTVAGGSAEKVSVTYTASGAEAAQGTMVFYTGAADTSGSELKLFANLAGPCIKTNPSHIAFGNKLINQTSEIALEIESCGDVALVINDIEMIEDADGVFGVNEATLGAFPLTIPAGQRVSVPVTYFPTVPATLGADGQFELDQGKLRIKSNAYLAELDVPVDGLATSGTCPIANIVVSEGDEVVPQTMLHLSGLGSTATGGGTINGYEWTVVQPSGSASSFAPSPYAAQTKFEANVVGEYIFRLNVTDSFGVTSCVAAEKRVAVTSDEAIHVELLWHTPGDANEFDVSDPFDFISAGSDVDLHFLHPKANGIYFTDDDCYWRNTNPTWGIQGSPSDDPSLDRDDTDGAGPENLNLDVPEQNTRYQVGVHYYDDWGYGYSEVTVRIYIYGVLRNEWANVRMNRDEMWDSHYIDWPSGNVNRIGVTPQITPDYLGF